MADVGGSPIAEVGGSPRQDFGTRLAAVMAERGPVCVGVDPHPFLLADWGLPDSSDGVRRFGLDVVQRAADAVGIVKPQVAFFERHGSAGFAALAEVMAAARAAGLIVVADAKRGDIGSTMAAYAQAWLSPGSEFEADAMTVVAYQGVGSLAGTVELALDSGKGLFVLAATSNPEAVGIQTARMRGEAERAESTVAAGIVERVHAMNEAADRLGSVGVVIGATVGLGEHGIDAAALRGTPVLAPGFGEQGADPAELDRLFGAASHNVVVAVSRSALRHGRSGLAAELRRLTTVVRATR